MNLRELGVVAAASAGGAFVAFALQWFGAEKWVILVGCGVLLLLAYLMIKFRSFGRWVLGIKRNKIN